MGFQKTFSSLQMTWLCRHTPISKREGGGGACNITTCRVVRALFALAERTKMDPEYQGPEFICDKRKSSQVSVEYEE